MVRNPWGITYYNKSGNENDTFWNSYTVAQVPHGIDPRTSSKDGIFMFDMSLLDDSYDECLAEFQVAHYRKNFYTTWYDVED